MKIRMLVLLVLLGAVLVSATVGTLSGYTSAYSFGTSISPDTQRILEQKQAVKIRETEEAQQIQTQESAEPETSAPQEEPVPTSETPHESISE